MRELYQRQKLRKEGKLKKSNYKNCNKAEKGTRGTDKSTWKVFVWRLSRY